MPPSPNAPLSSHWAFVVQVRPGTALTPESLHGRVEHIVSGQATGFTSLAELWAFMAQELTSPTNEQFVTLKQTPEAFTAVFRATGGSLPTAPTPARRRLPAGSRRRASTRRRAGE